MSGDFGSAGPHEASKPVTIAGGQTLAGIEIRLTPTAAISGRIVDQDGDPVPGLMVTASQNDWEAGRKDLQIRGFASTDDRGEYRSFDLPPGKYILAACFRNRHREDFKTTDTTSGLTPVTTFYPGTTDPELAQPIELKPADELDLIDFTLLPIHGVKVRGQIVNALTGKPDQGACVNLQNRSLALGFLEGQEGWACGDDPSGEFILTGVVPGSYELIAMLGQGTSSMNARVPIEVGQEGLDGVVVQLFPSIEIRGHVSVEGDSQMVRESLWLNLTPIDDTSRSAGQAQTDENGNFKIDSVPQGIYRLTLVWNSGDAYLKSVSLDSRDVADQTFTVDRNTSSKKLEVVVSARGATVEGMAVDDEKRPVAGHARGAGSRRQPAQSRRLFPELLFG